MARTKDGMFSTGVYLSVRTHKAIKKFAVDQDITLQDLLSAVIEEWWAKNPERAHYEATPPTSKEATPELPNQPTQKRGKSP
jgi:hypothetical protein